MATRKAPDLNGFLGSGTQFKGELRFPDSLRIEGSFEGKIVSPDASLIIAESGRVKASVEVAELFVAGNLDGTIRASRRLEVGPQGTVTGEVFSRNLIVRDGAVVDGICHMDGADPARLAKAEAEPVDPKTSDPAESTRSHASMGREETPPVDNRSSGPPATGKKDSRRSDSKAWRRPEWETNTGKGESRDRNTRHMKRG